MPPVWHCQVEEHAINRGKTLDVRLSLSVTLSTVQVLVPRKRHQKDRKRDSGSTVSFSEWIDSGSCS
ncbi:hypothetical protein TNCV_3984581 [Trichonephila clavipes]|nr:hypothetical protein TNCV_3984581 [Trichonephila clavipes]